MRLRLLSLAVFGLTFSTLASAQDRSEPSPPEKGATDAAAEPTNPRATTPNDAPSPTGATTRPTDSPTGETNQAEASARAKASMGSSGAASTGVLANPVTVAAPSGPASSVEQPAAAGPTAEDWLSAQQGHKVRANVFPEDRPPPGATGPQDDSFKFGAHGYFRAPLRMSWRRRPQAGPEEGKYDLRSPWLVDDEYFRSAFGYTPINETDWAEIYLQAGNRHVTGTVVLFASLYSDWARPIIDRQAGIAQAYLTIRHEGTVFDRMRGRLRIKGGAFWDRFGWIEKYDTYLFGRIHQMGEQVRAELDVGEATVQLQHGFGATLEDIKSDQGLALLNYGKIGLAYKRLVEGNLYYLRTWTQDKRQLQNITDASLRVVGAELRGDAFGVARGHLMGSLVEADQATYLSPSLEVMHSLGGRGITENYLGIESSNNGTGKLHNLGMQLDVSLGKLLAKTARVFPFGQGDVTLSAFGMYSYVFSDQKDPDPFKNRDERKYFKWGGEVAWWALSWLGVSARYDRVVLNVDDDANAYRVFSPRVSVRTHWIGDAALFLQWSRYEYGERVKLRAGQVPLENQPDDNVVKIQAQMNF